MATNTSPSFPSARRDSRQVTNTLKRTLNYNDSDIAKAGFFSGLPANAFITKVMVEIVTTFNAGSTNPITVGTNSTTYNNMVQSGDINPAATGVYEVTRGLGRSITAAADIAVYATYAPTGTAATQGQAVILIEYDGGWAS